LGADVVVVGGGIAGMAAAHRLQRAGADVLLLEKEPRLGGIVETTIEDGFVVEGGPDSFVTAKGSVLELASELGVEHEVISANPESQGSYVWWDGRLHPLPGGLLLMVPSRLAPFLSSSLLSWRGKVQALKDLALPRSRLTGDQSLGSFVRRRLGSEVLERIAEPLIAGIHAADPETMSLRASFPRFLDMEAEHRSLILAARRVDARDAAEGRSHFSSFRLGMGQLVSALASALDRVDIRTGSEVSAIESSTGGYTVVLDEGSRVTAPAVVLAVPAPVASRLSQTLSETAASAIAGIGQVSNQAVTLAYRSEHLPPLHGSGFVVPSTQGSAVRGVSYLSRKWTGRVPDGGFTLMRVFLAAGRDVSSPVEVARAELRSMIGVTADPVRAWVRRHRQGLHRYTVGHLERIAAAERALQARPGVVLAGAGFYGVGLNECISSGWDAAEKASESAGTRTWS
jgi:protoporphyrinogen/coproporphyrinogen III oxidase